MTAPEWNKTVSPCSTFALSCSNPSSPSLFLVLLLSGRAMWSTTSCRSMPVCASRDSCSCSKVGSVGTKLSSFSKIKASAFGQRCQTLVLAFGDFISFSLKYRLNILLINGVSCLGTHDLIAKLDALGLWYTPRPIDRVCLAAHICLPGIGACLTASACFLFPSECTAYLCSTCTNVYICNAAV